MSSWLTLPLAATEFPPTPKALQHFGAGGTGRHTLRRSTRSAEVQIDRGSSSCGCHVLLLCPAANCFGLAGGAGQGRGRGRGGSRGPWTE